MTTSASVVSGVAPTGADIAFHSRVTGEFKEWCDSLPMTSEGNACPLPTSPDGLPAGWTLLEHPISEVVTQFSHVYLARLDGGWVLLSHDPRDRLTFTVDSDISLLTMLDNAFPKKRIPPSFTDWLARVIASCYDPSDPNEAAEQMLCALGSRPRVPPLALT